VADFVVTSATNLAAPFGAGVLAMHPGPTQHKPMDSTSPLTIDNLDFSLVKLGRLAHRSSPSQHVSVLDDNGGFRRGIIQIGAKRPGPRSGVRTRPLSPSGPALEAEAEVYPPKGYYAP
jgi:hypothetical protein